MIPQRKKRRRASKKKIYITCQKCASTKKLCFGSHVILLQRNTCLQGSSEGQSTKTASHKAKNCKPYTNSGSTLMKQLIILNKDSIKFLNNTFLEYTRDALNEMIKEDIAKYNNFLKNFLFEINDEEILQNEDLVTALNDYNDMVIKEDDIALAKESTQNSEVDSAVNHIPPLINIEEAYMINKEHKLAKYPLKNYTKDRYALIGDKLSKQQIEQYDLFKSTKLPRSTVKKMILGRKPENVGLANNNQTLLSIIAGMMKLELLKVIEKAKLERNRDIKNHLLHLKSHRLFLMKETLNIVKVLIKLYKQVAETEDKENVEGQLKEQLQHQIARYNKRVEFLKESSIDKSPSELLPLSTTHLRRVMNNGKTKKNRLRYLK